MAKDGHCCDDQDEEDGYIDMDINPATCYTCCTAEEFEFQMSSRDPEADHSSTSPADEIFYKGKLLPLHLPPRLRMVETLLLLQKKPDNAGADPDADAASSTTPFASCNVSPATSCYVSGELSPEDFFFEEEEEEEGEGGCPREPAGPRAAKRSWAKKLRSIRLQSSSSLGLKLRASKAYIQSLFSKSSSAAKPKECSSKSKEERGAAGGEYCGGHRRSFSGAATALKRRSSNKFSSSSSSSCSSSDSSSSSSLKRSSSVSSDKECSVQGAIAHCKRSQQARQAFGRKSVSDVGFYLKSGPRVDAEREERN